MDILQIINTITLIVGIPSFILSILYLGRKLQVLHDLEPLRREFAIVSPKVTDLWEDRYRTVRLQTKVNPNIKEF